MSIRTGIEAIAALLAAFAIWHYAKPNAATVNQWQAAAVSPQVAIVPKVEIHPAKVEVFAQVAKKALNLPDDVQADPDKYVLASSRVASDLHPYTITTIFDKETGKSSTIGRREPLPWVAVEQTGELRFDAGLKNNMVAVGRLTFREDFAAVKALRFGVNASLDTDLSAFAGIGVGWRW